jgi:hypothetical protein
LLEACENLKARALWTYNPRRFRPEELMGRRVDDEQLVHPETGKTLVSFYSGVLECARAEVPALHYLPM